jgi:hypothetical protein
VTDIASDIDQTPISQSIPLHVSLAAGIMRLYHAILPVACSFLIDT